MNKKILFFILTLFINYPQAFSKNQVDSTIIKRKAQTVEKINLLLDSLMKISNDIKRLEINAEASKKIELLLSPSYLYFDTLKTIKKIGKIFSPDKKFCLITWNVPLIDGQNIFFGFIQVNPGNDSVCKLFQLNDVSNSLIKINVLDEYSSDKWLGALYYEIVAEKISRKNVYIILGSRLNDLKTNKKLIETFYFNDNEKPVFGMPILQYESKLQNRIIFEYAVEISMSLRYNENLKMIVFDHLSPSASIHKGDYKFYGPDFSYDGLKFSKDRWTFVPDVKVY
jgi:hypothetical protein